MDLEPIALRIARRRGDVEGVRDRTFEEFRSEWDGKDAFLRFEDPSPASKQEWVPASLNRDSSYGDIWGVWSFYLRHAWPKSKGSLTRMSAAYIFVLKGGRVLDTGSYSESDFARDFRLIENKYGKDAGNASSFLEERRLLIEAEGLPPDGPDFPDLSPADRIYRVVQHVHGTTRSTNFVLRKIGYDVLIDSAGVVSEGSYSPSVSAVVLNPALIDVVDSFYLGPGDRS